MKSAMNTPLNRRDFCKALAIGLFPLLLYFAVRRCLQAMNMVKPVAFALISANIVNALGNLIFVYGELGMPALGAVGSFSVDQVMCRGSVCVRRSMRLWPPAKTLWSLSVGSLIGRPMLPQWTGGSGQVFRKNS